MAIVTPSPISPSPTPNATSDPASRVTAGPTSRRSGRPRQVVRRTLSRLRLSSREYRCQYRG
jgi:hypothetical protein